MELIIEACEGGFFIAKLTQHDHNEQWLRLMCRRQGLTYRDNMRFHSLDHIRDYFAPLTPQSVWLVYNHAYDEMIGMPSSATVSRQPLYWYARRSKSA
ncbi:MAG TPA: DUF6482 family protein [Marinagarivorans sp.]